MDVVLAAAGFAGDHVDAQAGGGVGGVAALVVRTDVGPDLEVDRHQVRPHGVRVRGPERAVAAQQRLLARVLASVDLEGGPRLSRVVTVGTDVGHALLPQFLAVPRVAGQEVVPVQGLDHGVRLGQERRVQEGIVTR